MGEEIAFALALFLRLSQSLSKPARGGKRAIRKVYNTIDTFLDEGSVGLQPMEKLLVQPRGYKPGDAEKGRIRRGEEFVRAGYRSRAAKILRSDEEIQEATVDVVAHLRSKFPAPRTSLDQMPQVQDEDPRYVTELEDFEMVMKATFNGASGGPTGLMGDHIKAVLGLCGVLPQLHRLFTLLIDGQFPAWAQPYVCMQNVLALGDKRRPVCMSEWLMRTASKLTEHTVSTEHTKDYFLTQGDRYQVLQFGTDIRGGAEAVISLASHLVHEKGKGRVMIEKDGASAYQNVDRVVAIADTVDVFPTTSRWLKWCYGAPSLLRLGDSDFHEAGAGVYQGDALGGRVHDTTLQLALISAAEQTVAEIVRGRDEAGASPAQEEDTLCVIIAFRDDVYVLAEPQVAVKANHNIDIERKLRTNVESNKARLEPTALE